MFQPKATFSGVSVDDIGKAKEFYIDTLGLKLKDDKMGLNIGLPNDGELFVYPKDDHEPATFTVLNFVVDDINAAVDALKEKGVKFEHFEGGPPLDDRSIARGLSVNMGPDIAWFKDPAGNILAVLQPE